jgi:hypothetical protein
MESLQSIPILINGTDLTPKFRINVDITTLSENFVKDLKNADLSIYKKNVATAVCD